MIAREVTEKLTAWLPSVLPTGWNAYEAGIETVLARPCAIVAVEDVLAHEVLKGTYTVALAVTLTSVPEDTTLAAHEAAVGSVETLFADVDQLAGALEDVVGRVHFSEDSPSFIEESANLRLATPRATVILEANRARRPAGWKGFDYIQADNLDYIIP